MSLWICCAAPIITEFLDPSVTAQEKAEYGLPESFTDLEVYQLVPFGRKSPPTASSAIRPSPSPETSAMRPWPGFSKTRRIFRESISQRVSPRLRECGIYGALIGYTGLISADELEERQEEDSSYTATDIVGKSGLEQIMETTLQGDKGYEEIYVDNMGRTQR